ncbi:hypothetical protein ACHAWF_014050, partial [Thalassiosira exigua]
MFLQNFVTGRDPCPGLSGHGHRPKCIVSVLSGRRKVAMLFCASSMINAAPLFAAANLIEKKVRLHVSEKET